jgi:hypothetical protein
VTSKWPIPRPTENRALRSVTRTAPPLGDYPSLFAGLLVAYAAGDRRGTNLLGHRIARVGGVVGE